MNILSWLTKAISPATRAAGRRAHRPQVECLEDRLAPASATFSGGVFTLTGLAAAANNVTVSTPANNSVKIVLGNGDTFTSAPAGADFVLSQTVNPNDTLTVNTAAGHSPFATFQINLGSAADTLNFALSAASTGVGNVAINTPLVSVNTGAEQVNFGSVNIDGNLGATLFARSNIYSSEIIVAAASQITTHGGNINLYAEAEILVPAGASLVSDGGNITLSSNGPEIDGTLSAGSGIVTLQGVLGGGDTDFSISYTYSTTHHTTVTRVDLPVINVYSTTVIVSLPGMPKAEDLTFAKPFTDPAVQAAIKQLEQQLEKAGVRNFVGPTLISSAASTTSALVDPIVNIDGHGTTGTKLLGTTDTVTTIPTLGPATILFGDDQSLTFHVLAATENFNTNTAYETSVEDDFQPTVTTTQVYRIGTPDRWR
jgi:hypothetical protein